MSIPAGIQVYADKVFNNLKILNNLTISGTATITIDGTIIMNTNAILRRADNTTTRSLIFRTGSNNDWLLSEPSGGSTLALTQLNSGLNQNFTMGLGTASLVITGGASATLGVSSPATTGGHLFTGTLTASGATTVVALNTTAGTVTVTGVGDIAADATANAVIVNTRVTASTVGLVALTTTTAAAGSTPRIETVTFGVGTITIAIRNSDPATATGAGANYTFSFILFQL